MYYEKTAKIVGEAFKKLLSEKHLYQGVALDFTTIKQDAKECEMERSKPGSSHLPSEFDLIEVGKKEFEGAWIPQGASYAPCPTIGMEGRRSVVFDIPSVNTYCSKCGAAWPFNPTIGTIAIGEGQNQCFLFEYQCQQCKEEFVRFQIRREGLKIRLTGRDPIEVLPTPRELPKAMSKYFSNAHVAHNAGQTLAGIFLLRTFIEQYWRSLPTVKEFVARQPRATGDEQGDIYQGTLPDDFKARIPSLRDIYSKLSEAMHMANEDAALFEDCSTKIIKHFKAREIYEIP
jgi:hypothetical protein